MAKKVDKKVEAPVEEAPAKEEVKEEVKEVTPKAPFRQLVSAGGLEWYVDENGKKIED